MAGPKLEIMPDGSIRVTATCDECGKMVRWDSRIYDNPRTGDRFLLGSCDCPNVQHTFPMGNIKHASIQKS